jgi:DNA polymerase
MTKFLDPSERMDLLRACVDACKRGDYEFLEIVAEEPMEILVSMVRPAFQAQEGTEFCVADFSSIESAVAAWLTDCKRLLEVFRTKKDPYKDYATFLFNVDYDKVSKWQRKFCKPPVLGGAYRLSGGKIIGDTKTGLLAYAEGMGVEMTQKEANDSIKVFRELYPEFPEYWLKYERAAEQALRSRGDKIVCGKVAFQYKNPFLLVHLPSGRAMHYYKPKLEMRRIETGRTVTKIARGTDSECLFLYGVLPGEEYEEPEVFERRTFTYMGKSQKTGQWTRLDNHGGRWMEQITQAVARDVLARNGLWLPHLEGFKLIAHVHDEPITERRLGDDYRTVERLIEVMKTPIPEMPGLPLGAAGWEGPFYLKD